MFSTSLNNGSSEKTGTIKAFGKSAAPFGWLICDGSAISRTLYAALFDVIGETYGVGDGSTTFNIPDLSNKFLEGNGTGFVSAGLPNITGGLYNSSATIQDIGLDDGFGSGAISVVTDTNSRAAGTNTTGYRNYNYGWDLDASRSSSIYGNSNTVQPAACKCYFIIKY